MFSSNNRFSLTVLIVAMLYGTSLPGCGGQNAEAVARKRLVGKWEVATDAFREALQEEMAKKGEGSEKDAAMSAAVDGMLKNMKMNFEFTEDGKVNMATSMMGQDRSESGTYEIVAVEGDRITIIVNTSESSNEPGTLRFIDNDTIELTPPDEEKTGTGGIKTLVMKRVKA